MDEANGSASSDEAGSSQSFDQYLRELSDPSIKLKTAGLSALSALDTAQIAQLAEAWPQIEVGRRREMVQCANTWRIQKHLLRYGGCHAPIIGRRYRRK